MSVEWITFQHQQPGGSAFHHLRHAWPGDYCAPLGADHQPGGLWRGGRPNHRQQAHDPIGGHDPGAAGAPLIIIKAQEAIRAVPDSLRRAGLGLGATQWQTIWAHVLPNAIPGMLTGTILVISRAIGETAGRFPQHRRRSNHRAAGLAADTERACGFAAESALAPVLGTKIGLQCKIML